MRTALLSRPRRDSERRLRAGAVLAAALALVLSGCAEGDGSGDASTSAVSTGVPTVLVVDASASMLIDDAPGPRIDAARSAADGLIEALPDNAVLGLVTYGTSTDDAPESQEAGCRDVTTLAEPAGLDGEGHRETLSQQVASLSPSGYTPIAQALRQAAGLLPEGDTAVIVISDGEDSCGDPPCDTAAELREQNPGLRISTVGFKTSTTELACIARTTDGLFVTADDADQLASRLLAARNVDQNASALTPTGLGGIDVGTHYNDIVGAHSGFPAQAAGTAEGENIVITYVDCDYVFDPSGTVIEIRPHGGRTVDGLSVGDSLSRAVDLYGDEMDQSDLNPEWATDSDALFYTASREAGTAWKITSTGDTISTIALCRCLPGTGASGSAAGSGDARKTTTKSGQTEIVTYRPYLDDGSLAPGFEVSEGEDFTWGCAPLDDDSYRCGRMHTDQVAVFCSTDGRVAWCPVPGSSTEPKFLRYTPIEFFDSDYDPRPTQGPVPVYVDLANGQRCHIGTPTGNPRTDAQHFYSCLGSDYNMLWGRTGQSVFDTSGGTWTSLRAPMSTQPFDSVQVVRAVFFE